MNDLLKKHNFQSYEEYCVFSKLLKAQKEFTDLLCKHKITEADIDRLNETRHECEDLQKKLVAVLEEAVLPPNQPMPSWAKVTKPYQPPAEEEQEEEQEEEEEVEDDESAEDDDSTEDDEKKWRYQWLQAQSWLNCEKESTPVIHPNEENREEEDEEEEGEGEDEDEEEQEEEEEGERGVYYPPYYPPGHDARGTTVSTNMASHRHAVCPPYKQPGDEMICVDPSTGEEHVIIIPEGVYTGDKFDVCL